MTGYRLEQKAPHILTLIIMSSFASMGAVIFTPALPQIANYFSIPDHMSQLTISLFLIGYAIGQLIYGPIANRFGRKRALYLGIVISTFGSIISILAHPLNSFTILILGRLLEALGSSAGLVIAFTIINDFYYPEQARRVISYMTLAFAIIPGIATMVGGILVSQFNWISCFYFLLLYGLVLAIPIHFLTETATTLNKSALNIKHVSHNYWLAFKNPILRNTSLYFGLSTLCIYAFTASAPIIAIRYLGLSSETYGFVGLIPFIGTACGSLVSARLACRFKATQLIKLGYIIELLTSLAFAVLFFFGLVHLGVLMAIGFCFMFGACIILSNGTSIASAAIEDKATASAVMNFINVGMPVFGTLILSVIPGNGIIKLPVIFISALVIMQVIRYFSPQLR